MTALKISDIRRGDEELEKQE